MRNRKKQKIYARKALFSSHADETGASECGVSLEQREQISTQSESEYSFHGEHRFDADIEEEKQIRAAKAQKEAILGEKYSQYHDPFESFVDDTRPLVSPDNLDAFV